MPVKHLLKVIDVFTRRYVLSSIHFTIDWLDEHGGAMNAGATIIIALLTWSLTQDLHRQADAAHDQFLIMKGQLDEMKSSSEQVERAIAAANRQAKAAEEAAKIAGDSVVLAQRAWVGPENASITAEPKLGVPVEITVQYKNTGHQPAQFFTTKSDLFLASDEEDKNGAVNKKLDAFFDACKHETAMVGAGVVYPTSGFDNYKVSQKTTDNFVDEALVSGTKMLVVEGCFTYWTISEAKHAYFCYFYKKGTTNINNLNICARGHFAD